DANHVKSQATSITWECFYPAADQTLKKIQVSAELDGHIIAALQDENKALKNKVAEKTQEISDVKRDCEATQKSLGEKLAKVEAELKEAKKPPLPNKVTLRNPIPIIGSLKGALDKVDDQFFRFDLPFAITLFNHRSEKVFVTDNGMLCMDQATDARKYKDGKSLPFRSDDFPVYSLFPFWADLMIGKDKPHGIFWEMVGNSPARSLIVEWYVTRFGQESQFFHFNLLYEEARPNVVTFKYYDTAEEGNHTIGVQGPNSYKMFSHDQKRRFEGVQVVFNTAADTMQSSTFPIRH
ncbi:MAG: hypothetical protein Q9217_002218, partial [Psora testacea]